MFFIISVDSRCVINSFLSLSGAPGNYLAALLHMRQKHLSKMPMRLFTVSVSE